jgi:hypothetical protein
LARTPYVWDLAMLCRKSKRITLAGKDTAIVIDGFLRSGNTFSVAAFTVANGELPMGRHLHGAPHILRAVRLGLPTVVLIRDPADAVPSYLIRRPSLTPADALLEYLDFYRTAWPARAGFVVAVFDDVVKDFGAVTRRVNDRFGTSFVPYEPTPDNEQAAFELVEEMNRLECRGEVVETHVGRPSADRADRKREIQQLMSQPRAARLLAEAQALFHQYAETAGSIEDTATASRTAPRIAGKPGSPHRAEPGFPAIAGEVADAREDEV